MITFSKIDQSHGWVTSTLPAPLLQDSPIPWHELNSLTTSRALQLGLKCRTLDDMCDRYRNVLPYDYNCWQTTNGSCISFPFKDATMPVHPQYVAMCAPIPSVVNDIILFFSAQKIPLLLTLTPFEKEKAEPYMPQNEGEIQACGYGLSIKCDETKEVTFESFHGFERRYSLHEDSKEVHTFTEIQIIDWEDKTGGNAKSVFALSDRVDQFRKSDVPIVVSCSAGIGRTGTFIVADQIKLHVERSEPFKVNDLVSDLRMQRRGCVQNEEQYTILFEVAGILIPSIKNNSTK